MGGWEGGCVCVCVCVCMCGCVGGWIDGWIDRASETDKENTARLHNKACTCVSRCMAVPSCGEQKILHICCGSAVLTLDTSIEDDSIDALPLATVEQLNATPAVPQTHH